MTTLVTEPVLVSLAQRLRDMGFPIAEIDHIVGDGYGANTFVRLLADMGPTNFSFAAPAEWSPGVIDTDMVVAMAITTPTSLGTQALFDVGAGGTGNALYLDAGTAQFRWSFDRGDNALNADVLVVGGVAPSTDYAIVLVYQSSDDTVRMYLRVGTLDINTVEPTDLVAGPTPIPEPTSNIAGGDAAGFGQVGSSAPFPGIIAPFSGTAHQLDMWLGKVPANL